MRTLPIRLVPGDDLIEGLQHAVSTNGCDAAFVLAGIGSLSIARLRFAGVPEPEHLVGDMEILTLSGSVSPTSAHLHMSISTSTGDVLGGHVGDGCIVRTTGEILLALLPEWTFGLAHDPRSGYEELVVTPAAR